MIEVLKSGPANCVQDGGRLGLLHIGVSRSGAMDRLAFDLANALLDNPADAAVIEVSMFPFRVRFDKPTRIALAGADALADLDGRPLPPCWTVPVSGGSVLTLRAPRAGARVVLGVAGGIDVPVVLGSRSTDLKTGFGGYEGRGLRAGDHLSVGEDRERTISKSGFGVLPNDGMTRFWANVGTATEVRIIPAAEFEEFSPEVHSRFFETTWTVSNEANRMGYRLDGPSLERSKTHDLLSHGLLPGVVQVPSSGLPIIQLADANTCGGYPKIAVIIAADLWKVAQLAPGAHLRFAETTAEDGMRAAQAQADLVERTRRAARDLINAG